jgi:hypothetical protein
MHMNKFLCTYTGLAAIETIPAAGVAQIIGELWYTYPYALLDEFYVFHVGHVDRVVYMKPFFTVIL